MKINKLIFINIILLALSGQFTVPDLGILNITIEARYLLLITLILLFVILINSKMKEQKMFINIDSSLFLVLSCGLLLLLMLSFYYSINNSLAIDKFINMIFIVIIMVSLFISSRLFRDKDEMLRLLALTFVAIGFIYSVLILSSVFMGEGRGTIYVGGYNVTTRIVFFSFISSIYLYISRKSIIYLLLSLLFLVDIVLIGSRGGMVGAAVAIFLMIILKPLTTLKWAGYFLKVPFNRFRYLVVLVSTLVISIPIIMYAYTVFQTRFIDLLVDGIYFSGRDRIYQNTILMIDEAPLFGNGLEAYNSIHSAVHPHNIFLEVTLEVGMVGLVLFLLVVAFAVITLYKAHQKNYFMFSIVPVYMIVVSLFSGDMYDFRFFFFWMIILLTCISFDRKPVESHNKIKLQQLMT